MPEMDDIIVIPFIRVARLIKLKETPTQEQALSIVKGIQEVWLHSNKDYKETISKQINGTTIKDFRFADNEKIRQRWEGDTCVLDCPLLVFRNGKDSLETRLCVSICTGPMSTKVWGRVGKPLVNSRRVGVKIEEITEFIQLNRSIARKSVEWMSRILEDNIKNIGSRFENSTLKWLEILVFGIKDTNLEEYFNLFWETDIKMKEILKKPEANKSLSFYFKKISPVSDLCNFSNIRDNGNCHFYTSPVMVTVNGGYIEPREVLYLDRKLNKERFVIGIGYDDSIDGNLSPKSSLKIATYYGKKE